MTDPEISSALGSHPFTKGLTESHLATLTECTRQFAAQNGEYLVREGGPADSFFLIQSGRVAIEVQMPERGAVRIQTLEAGEVVGWSWLVPPYKWQFDGRVVESVRALVMDAACLRRKCEQDHDLGYQLLYRLVAAISGRLSATRLQLLDVYR